MTLRKVCVIALQRLGTASDFIDYEEEARAQQRKKRKNPKVSTGMCTKLRTDQETKRFPPIIFVYTPAVRDADLKQKGLFNENI